MFDTHCHLNFSAFKKNLNEVIARAHEAGVEYFVVPGTDVKRSLKAIEVAQKYENVYAAVGIHPHHIFQYQRSNIKDQSDRSNIKKDIQDIEKLLKQPKVVAIGEVGLDFHVYQKTKYKQYGIDDKFIDLQKELLEKQIQLAIQYNKSLILHNREAKKEMLEILNNVWDKKLEGRTVFHCCEPDKELLEFARQHQMFIGVDGDVTYSKEKQEFLKQIPLEMLVLETDSPFLLPEQLRSRKQYPNEPKNLSIIVKYISQIRKISMIRIIEITTKNAKRLFSITI